MKLNLLDVDNFIQKKNIQEVKTIKYYKGSSRNEFHPQGLFSEEIFGRTGSVNRKKTYGFVDLKFKFIHPEAFQIMTSINPNLTKLILEKQNYIITNEGILEKNDEEGQSGLYYFLLNFDKLDFDKIKTEKPDNVEFIKNNRDKVFIDKLLVLPAGLRDAQVDEKTGRTIIQYPEIGDLYSRLIRQVNNINTEIEDIDINTPVIRLVQRTIIEINNWLKSRMKGKHGMLRGGLLKKVTDYSGRLVITPDNNLKMGYVGLSWHHCLKLFEPFVLHYLLYKDHGKQGLLFIQTYLNLKNEPDINDISQVIKKMNDEPNAIPEQMIQHFKMIAEEVVDDRMVIYKRDPVENRDSWTSCYVRVDDSQYVMKINSFDLNKNGKLLCRFI